MMGLQTDSQFSGVQAPKETFNKLLIHGFFFNRFQNGATNK